MSHSDIITYINEFVEVNMAVDLELLRGISLMKQGNEAGFNILYSNTYNFVYSRAKVIMQNEQDAMDLTQEAYIQAFRGINSLEDPRNIYAWLGAIVYNQGMKIYRKRKNELLVDEEAESIFEDIVSTDISTQPEEAMDRIQTADIVMGMINELPELQRATIMAYYYDEMKIDDIARTFECSSNTVKSRLNYAKKALKEKVEEHEKKNRYKLCAFSPLLLFLAIRALLASKSSFFGDAAVRSLYSSICGSVGFMPSPVVLKGSMQTSCNASMGQTSSVQSSVPPKSVHGAPLVQPNAAVSKAAKKAAKKALKKGSGFGRFLRNSAIALATAAVGTAGVIGAGHYIDEKKNDSVLSYEDIDFNNNADNGWEIKDYTLIIYDNYESVDYATTDEDMLKYIKRYVFGENLAPWGDKKKDIRKIIIEDGVTEIGSGAFYGLSKVKSVEIPDSVTRLGACSFSKLDRLETLTIPGSVITFEHDAFSRCKNLRKVVIEDGITFIPEHAFRSCKNLKEVHIPASVTGSGTMSFAYIKKLEKIYGKSGTYAETLAAECKKTYGTEFVIVE